MTRILAVDDEPLLLELVVDELEMHGFVVQAAADGEAAKALLASNSDYDVLVTDLRMPGKVDGLALARYFLDHNGVGRVIYVTGFAEIPQTFSARETLLRKPFRMGQLVSLIEATL
jgi:CheY-like chemotaxis protein